MVEGPKRFLISMSGLLTPCIDQSITGDSGGGMNKGGGEFSWSGEGVIKIELSVTMSDSAGVKDIVDGVCVGEGRFWFWAIVESGRHDGWLFKERVLILLD